MTKIPIVVSFAQDAVQVAILASLPAISASLVVGLIVAIFSATTQINEQTLSFAPKMIAVYLSLILCGGWLGHLLIQFGKKCFWALSSM